MARRLPLVVTVLAAAAAWTAARHALFMPLLWLALLLATLALPVVERRLLCPASFGLVLALVAVGQLVALDHELAVRHSLLLLAALLVLGLARRCPPGDDQLWILALAIAATAVLAGWQASGGLAQAQAEVVQLPRALREAAATRLAAGRVFGTASLPGHYALLLLMAAPLLVPRLYRGGWVERGAAALGLVGIGVGITLTRSFAALAVGAILTVVAVGRGLPRRPLLLGAGAVVLVLLVLTVVWRRDHADVQSVPLRLVNWQTALSVFAANPWLGVGLGGIGQAGLVTPTAAANITPYTHNTYLQLLAEVGLLGLPVVAAGLAWLCGVVRSGLREAPALALAVLAVPIHNLVDFSAYQPELLLPWAVLVGALAARTKPLPRKALPSGALVPVLVVGCVASVAAWRGETELSSAVSGPPESRLDGMLVAVRWQPWSVTPLLMTVDAAFEQEAPPPELKKLDQELERRWWVRPRSGAWAQARAMLLLGQERRGEAVVWVREARRRAPLTPGLDALEASCAPR